MEGDNFLFLPLPSQLWKKRYVENISKVGSVEEVFISRKLNRWGNRFGFVSLHHFWL